MKTFNPRDAKKSTPIQKKSEPLRSLFRGFRRILGSGKNFGSGSRIAGPQRRFSSTDRWHGARVDIALPLAIFLFALTLRLIYLFQIERIPLFYHLAGDARSYDEWAQRIAAGDWLGQGIFYQAPLYPYFLGLLQVILGHDLWTIRVAQIVLGALSCVFLYGAGRLFFSRGAGVAAGLILSLYAPAIFFDALIQKAVLYLFLIGLLLLFLGRAQLRVRWADWAVVGVVLGLLALTRENALIWVLVVPIWIWFYFSELEVRRRLGWIGIFLVGLALVLFPVGLRNLKAGGEFTLTTSQLGPNFFIGNNPSADGTYAPLRPGHGDPQFERQDATELAERARGRRLSPGEVSAYWSRRAWDYIFSQPLDWLRLMGRKWLLVWNFRELEDAEDFYLYQRWSSLLGGLGRGSHFGVLAPLGALGLVLTWRQWRKLWLLYGLLMTLAFSVALFYVFGRYRFPMVSVLTLFAGAGLARAWTLFREGKVREGLPSAIVLILSAMAVHYPLSGRPAPSAAALSNLGNAFAKEGRSDGAIESYRQALTLQPDYAAPHYGLGNLFAANGQAGEAIRHYQEAIRIQPDFAEAHNNLGNVLASQGELEGAIQHFHTALELGLVRGEIYFNLGVASIRQGHFEEARAHFESAVKIKPGYAAAYNNLGKLTAGRGDLDGAIQHFRQAVGIQPEFADAHENLGRALALQGNREEAMKHYQEALRIMKSRSEARTPR